MAGRVVDIDWDIAGRPELRIGLHRRDFECWLREVVFTLDSPRRVHGTVLGAAVLRVEGTVPRVARLMALAIRLEGLIRTGAIRDYAEVARRGRVTRARVTQIMKLMDLAPDVQETILLLPPSTPLKEKNLRRITCTISWREQRQLFQELAISEASASAQRGASRRQRV